MSLVEEWMGNATSESQSGLVQGGCRSKRSTTEHNDTHGHGLVCVRAEGRTDGEEGEEQIRANWMSESRSPRAPCPKAHERTEDATDGGERAGVESDVLPRKGSRSRLE